MIYLLFLRRPDPVLLPSDTAMGSIADRIIGVALQMEVLSPPSMDVADTAAMKSGCALRYYNYAR